MRSLHTLLPLLLLVTALSAVSGCGKKGPLYLPKPLPPQAPAQAPAPTTTPNTTTPPTTK